MIKAFDLPDLDLDQKNKFQVIYNKKIEPDTEINISNDKDMLALDDIGQVVSTVFIAHPYFGYIKRSFDPLDELGEELTSRTEPILKDKYVYPRLGKSKEKNSKVFSIGIFGGSVAVDVFEYNRDNRLIEKALKARVPSLQNKDIKVFNMAVSAGAQPQQMLIFTQFSEMFDLTINLDGLNEFSKSGNSLNFGVESPNGSDLMFPNKTEGLALLGKTYVYSQINEFIDEFEALSFSFTYSLFRNLARKLMLASLHSKENVNGAKGAAFKNKNLVKVKLWGKYTHMQDTLAKKAGVEAFFFLQPNQYIKDSKKTLLPEEINQTSFETLSSYTNSSYSLLREEMKTLEEDEVLVKDLSYIYKDESRLLYDDECCHLNEEGNRILLEEIIKFIVLKKSP
ncbi:MAG: hypothetical protein ACJAT2_000390 [Bacteriovoracaceae bacterium]|jgi:hypothetical protein